MKKFHMWQALGLVAILVSGIDAATVWAQEAVQPQPASQKTDTSPESQEAKRKAMGFPDLLGGLRATEGCLKAIGAKTSDGKTLLIGWFEDKEAAKRWYFGDMHQAMLDRFQPMRNRGREPMKWVPADAGPIMVVASITFSDDPADPFSQISIELYSPLTGGFGHGGLFGPDSFKEMFMRYDQYTDEELGKEEASGDSTEESDANSTY